MCACGTHSGADWTDRQQGRQIDGRTARDARGNTTHASDKCAPISDHAISLIDDRRPQAAAVRTTNKVRPISSFQMTHGEHAIACRHSSDNINLMFFL